MISPAFLVLGLVKSSYQSGSQDDGCHVVQKMGTRRSGHVRCQDSGCQADIHMNPSGGNQVLWIHESFRGNHRLSGSPDVHPGFDTGQESSEKFKFQGQLEQERHLSSCLNLYNVNNFSTLVKVIVFYRFPIFSLSSDYMLGTNWALIMHQLLYVIITLNHQNNTARYYLHFTGKETGSERLEHKAIIDRASIWLEICPIQYLGFSQHHGCQSNKKYDQTKVSCSYRERSILRSEASECVLWQNLKFSWVPRLR